MLEMLAFATPGLSNEVHKKVEIDDTVGNISPYLNRLLSTSACMEAFVKAAIEVIDPRLPEGYITVGRSMEIVHEAPTLLGSGVSFRVILREVSENRLFFDLEASDSLGVVCRGRHERAVVNRVGLMDRAVERLDRARARDEKGPLDSSR